MFAWLRRRSNDVRRVFVAPGSTQQVKFL